MGVLVIFKSLSHTRTGIIVFINFGTEAIVERQSQTVYALPLDKLMCYT